VLWRLAVGIVAVAIGIVWIGQGVGSIHGSFMTGHSQYSALGVILVVFGAAMLAWAAWRARARRRPAP
jgi:predicted MFS family arabinose efflux permease